MRRILSPDIFPALFVVLIHIACLVSIVGKLTADNHRHFAEKDKKREYGKRSDAVRVANPIFLAGAK